MVYQHQKTIIATFLAFWQNFEFFLRIRPDWPEPDIRWPLSTAPFRYTPTLRTKRRYGSMC